MEVALSTRMRMTLKLTLCAALMMWIGSGAAFAAPNPANVRFVDVPGSAVLTPGGLPGIENLRIGNITSVPSLAIKDFPGLSQVPLGQVPGFDPTTYGIDPTNTNYDWQQLTIQDAVDQGLLDQSVLDSPVSDFADLQSLRLGQVPNITSLTIDQIPGLTLSYISSLGLNGIFPQYVDHVNFDGGGFTEFNIPSKQRFKVNQEVIYAGSLKVRHTGVNEKAGTGNFELYILTSCGPFCTFWLGPFPWPGSVENNWWLGPGGNVSTKDLH
jgi:hypothetical protein